MSHANHGPALEKGVWFAISISTVIVTLRVFAKFKINRFFVDDVLMIVAQILAIIGCVFLTLCVQNGFGQNLETLPAHNRKIVLQYLTAVQVPVVTLSTTIARSAFIIYLLGILGTNKTIRLMLWAILFIQLIGNIASSILPLVICHDIRILWETVETTCGNLNSVIQFAYYSNTFNSATDLFLAIFPTVVFWNLNLKLQIKLGLIALLSLGVVAMVASIVKTTKLTTLPSLTNLGAGGGIEIIRWAYIENAVIIITSSIPCIRPLVIASVHKISSAKYSYQLSGPFSSRRTKENTTQQSQHSRRINMSHHFEDGSVERILNQSSHTSTTIGGNPDSPHQLPADHHGITKQVEISVLADAESAKHV
ncbi:hypothetical protein N7495_007380 [Penicillium taxi]|uniref:uncharacterized protein n=1 Tax=Penicillium taxi TaxID=168475 RepID=UPI002544F0F5|nr:uncharacterized protein N7495_007380 [Penicillium taxi]KAJ5895689.1 hypothetical protein N7495_007380 [Penicillium taxi]